jgi:hypothetical protein
MRVDKKEQQYIKEKERAGGNFEKRLFLWHLESDP